MILGIYRGNLLGQLIKIDNDLSIESRQSTEPQLQSAEY